jgi:hypothetical protein
VIAEAEERFGKTQKALVGLEEERVELVAKLASMELKLAEALRELDLLRELMKEAERGHAENRAKEEHAGKELLREL